MFPTKQLKEDSYRARLEEQEKQLIEEEKKVFISGLMLLNLTIFIVDYILMNAFRGQNSCLRVLGERLLLIFSLVFCKILDITHWLRLK